MCFVAGLGKQYDAPRLVLHKIRTGSSRRSRRRRPATRRSCSHTIWAPDGWSAYGEECTASSTSRLATTPLRALEDSAAEHLPPPELVRLAALDALHRGPVARDELDAVEVALEPLGGLEP